MLQHAPTPKFQRVRHQFSTQTSSANASIWCRVRSRWERGIGCETRQPQCELGEDSRSISPIKSPEMIWLAARPMGNWLKWSFCHSLAIQKTWKRFLDNFLSWNMDFVSAFEILHKYTSLGGQPLCCEFWQPACYSRLRRHSRHEGFNNGVLLAYSFASNETQPTFWTVNRSSLLPVRKLKAKRAATFTW